MSMFSYSSLGGEDTNSYGLAMDREFLEECGALEKKGGEQALDLSIDEDDEE